MNVSRFLIMICASFLWTSASSAQILDKIKQSKNLRVCLESGYMPMEMKTSSGKWLGFDVDMMTAFAKHLDVKLDLLDTKWDGIIPSLLSGKCDLIASSMAKTQEREKVVAFSDPYYQNQLLLAVRNTPENVTNFQCLEDFNHEKFSVSVKTGSSSDLFLNNSGALKKAKILKFDADSDIVSAVLTGKSDAFIYDTPYVKMAALSHPGKLHIVPQGFNGDEFGVAFKKSNNDLRESFNQFLRQWKESSAYEKSLKYYFDGMEWSADLQK